MLLRERGLRGESKHTEKASAEQAHRFGNGFGDGATSAQRQQYGRCAHHEGVEAHQGHVLAAVGVVAREVRFHGHRRDGRGARRQPLVARREAERNQGHAGRGQAASARQARHRCVRHGS